MHRINSFGLLICALSRPLDGQVAGLDTCVLDSITGEVYST